MPLWCGIPELIEISSARIACASWEIRMFSSSPQSWLAYIVPVAPFHLAGTCFTRLQSSSFLQCHSVRMWQGRVWWGLLIVSHKVHWDSDLFFFFFLCYSFFGSAWPRQLLHIGQDWSLVGSLTKVVVEGLTQPFCTVAVVVMSKECPSLVWVGFLGVVSGKVLLVYSQQV